MSNNEMCANRDWEAELKKAEAYTAELKMQLWDAEEKAKCMREEIVRYQAIVKTMEFVLGRKFE